MVERKPDPRYTLTRQEIKKAIANQLDVSFEEASHLFEAILEGMTEILVFHDFLKIQYFGTFLVHKKNERLGRNPKTREEAIISKRKSVSFRASKSLREKVNLPYDHEILEGTDK